MNINAILYAGIVATSVMTAFSYVLSAIRKKNFREPALLAGLLQGLQPSLHKTVASIAGWQLHYTVGLIWAGMYACLPVNQYEWSTVITAVVFGSFCGAISVFTWMNVFRLHPDPPIIDYYEFYIQLFVGHILFSIVLSEMYAKQT